MRSESEIKKEIAKLKALKPFGPHAYKTQLSISAAVEELEFGLDRTAEEWNELTESERSAADAALNWKEGYSGDRPSAGWEGFAK